MSILRRRNRLKNIGHWDHYFLLCCLFTILTACTSIDKLTGLPVGENIIIPFDESIADWQEFTLDDGNYQFTLWQSPVSGFADSYSLSIAFDEQKNLADFRKLMDKSGEAQCDYYNSELIYLPYRQPTKSLLWLFSCNNNNGTKAKILHLVLQGQKNFYHLQKNWQYQYNKDDITKWTNQFATAYLCNTADIPATCPIVRN